MPKNGESTKLTFYASSSHPTVMALAKVGNGSSRTTTYSQGNCRFAAIAVDYFTKWVEAKPLANIKAPTIQKFFWQDIIFRFGVPRELTVDNGKQFDYYTFKEYCKSLCTHAKFSLVYHPQPEQLKG
jgi:hypothetical protein